MENTPELNSTKVAISFTSVVAGLYLICASLFAINPELTLGFFNNIFHGIDLTKIVKTPIHFDSVIIGFIEIVLSALAVSWLFAVLYNRLLK